MAKKNTQKKYKVGTIYSIPVNTIMTDPDQPRKFFDPEPLEELSKSIKKHGVLQPILFRVDSDEKVILISGERRLKAAEDAGVSEIPGIFSDGNPMEIALVENLLREDLTAVEEAEAMKRLADEHKYTHEQIAEALGKARPTITGMMSVNNLPDEIRAKCRADNKYSRRELIKIAAAKSIREQKALFEKYEKRLIPIDTKRKRERNQPKNEVMKKIIVELTGKIDKARNNLQAKEKESIKTEVENLIETAQKFLSELE